MELLYRNKADVFVPPGAYRTLEERLRERSDDLAEIPAAVVACFDRRTRLLPFVMYDRFIFPAGARTVAGALWQAGFSRTRAVFELWNPNFRPSAARLDGRLPQLLLLSTMNLHARRAKDHIRDAWTLGEDRPLILVGGSKTFHEGYQFWPIDTPNGPVGPDAVVTGEVYVLLDLLNVLMDFHRRGEPLRAAFERARHAGALDEVPGLLYLAPEASWREPVLVDTGLQRLVQHLDELPQEVSGLALMEPPHKKAGLSAAPVPDNKVRYHARIVSLLMTQGCKFNCGYCPIPTLNQKTWRFRSPENLAHQFRSVRERYDVRFYFGCDDNFFNHRQTSVEFLEELARTKMSNGKRLGRHIRWGTEATQHDTWKNRELLEVAARGGMGAIWFGIEDLTAELINKGQKPQVTQDLFRLMHQHKICPMAMMMYHEGQPFRTRGSLYGLANQVQFLRQAGAVSVQITVHTPAVGTREYEALYESGRVIESLGGEPLPDSVVDGNHVMMRGELPCWRRQLNLMRGYFTFYNPLNLLRAMRKDSPLRWYRTGYQLAGFLAALLTFIKLLPYILRLAFRKPRFHQKAPPMTRVPVRLAKNAFPRVPTEALQPECAKSGEDGSPRRSLPLVA
jgi:radical SAM superfamily enzyme YgiQ (UPF0313 family)